MTTYFDPNGRPYPPHMQHLLAKCRAHDERTGWSSVSVADVTPAGYGPEPSSESVDAWPIAPQPTVEQQRLRNAIAEGRTVLRGKLAADKRTMTERAVNAALAKLNHDV